MKDSDLAHRSSPLSAPWSLHALLRGVAVASLVTLLFTLSVACTNRPPPPPPPPPPPAKNPLPELPSTQEDVAVDPDRDPSALPSQAGS